VPWPFVQTSFNRIILTAFVAGIRRGPTQVLTKREPLMSAIDAYKAFDLRQPGWVKVELAPAKVGA